MTLPKSDYVCRDCKISFCIFYLPDRKPNCPKCGDPFGVRFNTEDVKLTDKKYARWTVEELELIDKYFENELTVRQIASITGRTVGSVRNKIGRVYRDWLMRK